MFRPLVDQRWRFCASMYDEQRLYTTDGSIRFVGLDAHSIDGRITRETKTEPEHIEPRPDAAGDRDG